MRLLLIRHGETVDNVARVYAGTTDSALTNHGVLEANRLSNHLATTGMKVSHIFSSDLQRAVKTADAIRLAQSFYSQSSAPTALEIRKLELLREQDFGFYEGKAYYERSRDSNKSKKETHLEAHGNDPGFKDVESKESMRARMDKFIDENLLDLFDTVPQECSVAIVAHGIILSHLWKGILRRFPQRSVSVASSVIGVDRVLGLEHIGGWSNTGYLDLELRSRYVGVQPAATQSSGPPNLAPAKETSLSDIATPVEKLPIPASSLASGIASPPDMSSMSVPVMRSGFITPELPRPKLLNLSLVIKAVNSMEHLKGLKKTRGGIGSLKHDSSQKTMDSFFVEKRRSS